MCILVIILLLSTCYNVEIKIQLIVFNRFACEYTHFIKLMLNIIHVILCILYISILPKIRFISSENNGIANNRVIGGKKK